MRRKVYEIHISDVGAFKNCRRAWDLSSPLRRNLVPIGKYLPFFTGSAVHHALEHIYRDGTLPAQSLPTFFLKELASLRADPKMWEAQQPLIESEQEEIYKLLEHYIAWQGYDQTNLSDRHFEFLEPEMQFKTKLWGNTRRKIDLAGTFDGLVLHKPTLKYYLWEIKTTRSLIERTKQLDLDEQTAAYLWAVREVTGLPVEGIVYTLIRKKAPATPKVLKNGLLSRAITGENETTAAWYLKSIREHHRDNATREFIKEQYNDVLAELLTGGNKFFSRIIVTRTPDELERFRDQLTSVALEMIDPRVHIYPNPNPRCNYCLYRSPCILMNREPPESLDRYLAAQYQPNPRYSEGAEE